MWEEKKANKPAKIIPDSLASLPNDGVSGTA